MISVFGFRGPKTFFQTPLGGKGNQKVSRGKNLLKSVCSAHFTIDKSYFGDWDLSSDKLRWEGKLKIAFNTNTFLGGNSKKAYQEKGLLQEGLLQKGLAQKGLHSKKASHCKNSLIFHCLYFYFQNLNFG